MNYRKMYKDILKKRRNLVLNNEDIELIKKIKKETKKRNIDNISRTKAYNHFYLKYKEIQWAFLASIVSRNAGWNMTDLEGNFFPLALNKTYRSRLFETYERANWLIFEDAFPQLLLYEASKNKGYSLFYLLKAFNVSTFMEIAWECFFKNHDKQQLMISLIINEQNVIEKPVIQQPFYKKNVFKSLPYQFEDSMHFSVVLFPTLYGELYGYSVHDFRHLSDRISLGKDLAQLLFHPEYYQSFRDFSDTQEHTGSRDDYEKFIQPGKLRDTPFLRLIYPIIDHKREKYIDWFNGKQPINKWLKMHPIKKNYHITKWFQKKRTQLLIGILTKFLLTGEKPTGK